MSRAGKLPVVAAAIAAFVGAAALVPATTAQAQQIYRSVGPDGKVTFSDQPPADTSKSSVKGKGSSSFTPAETSSTSALPYALQQAVNRFPVTLYTGDDCSPCTSARNLLITRGVPFTERTINNNESIDALKALSGENNLPFGTIGSQHLKGFADTVWTQYLDAAGYPKTSQLPPNYRRPPATPLATAKEAAQPEAADAPATPKAANRRPMPAQPADQTAPAGPTPSNPTGLVF